MSDWHSVIDWWFNRYAPYSAAAKTQAAYIRGLDYEDCSGRKGYPGLLKRKLNGETLTDEESKLIFRSHLFWYSVKTEGSTQFSLPVKIHTGLRR